MKLTKPLKCIKVSNRVKIIILAAVSLAALLLLLLPHQTENAVPAMAVAAHKEYNWYILPKNDGTQPTPNEQAGFIKDYKAWYVGSANEKTIYLTFDAGYENGFTPSMLDTLKKHKAPAAFFLVGNYIRRNPELVKRMNAEGHLVCNHTMNHPDMAAITDFEKFKTEVTGLEELCKDTAGVEMAKFFRPPEGKFSELALKYAQQLGYTTVFWSFAYVDWLNDKQPSEDEGMKKIIGRTHPGAIVLLHANSKTNAAILDRVITRWEEMGYTLKSLNDFKP